MSAGTRPDRDIYAHTLLDLAVQSRALEPVAADLDTLSALMAGAGLQGLPRLALFQRVNQAGPGPRVFAGRLHELTLNFLAVSSTTTAGCSGYYRPIQQLYRAHQGYQAVRWRWHRP